MSNMQKKVSKIEKVSIVSCKSYKNSEVKKALIASLKNINFELSKNKTVLLKPNILYPMAPDKAITTHPVLVEELCKLLKQNNNKIIIGDSSAYDTDKALKISGMLKLKKYAQIVNFESLDKKTININNKKIKQIRLPKLLSEVDLIINLPKLKTHALTRLSCSVKNLYGCISGNTKENLHRILPFADEFSKLLLDIYEEINPGLNIIDAVEGIEGEGPGTSGTKIKTGLIIASRNALASDIVSADIIGYKKNSVWTNKYGLKRNPIEIEKIGNAKNKKVFYIKPKTNLSSFFLISKFMPKPKIHFNHEKCIKCGLCSRKCPVNAISLNPFPECNHEKCVRCLCCIEVCPKNAIYLKHPWIRRAFTFIYRKVKRV